MLTELRKIPGLNDGQIQSLCLYYDLIIEGNKRMNLTAITDPVEAASKHFADSLCASEYIKEGAKCIDVGTGAGLPGIPLAIARPDIRITLLDSLNKRVKFLEEACEALGLSAHCVHSRAEDAGKSPIYREKYDTALSRAVAPLNVLLELTVPFVKLGGAALLYKGKAARAEASQAQNAAERLGCELSIIEVRADYGERYIVMAKKTKQTPAKYPRKAGEPSRRPI